MRRELSFHGVIAVIIMVVATIAGLELATINVEAPYLVLLPGVLFAAIVGGAVSATIAVLLGGLVTWFYFIPPYWSFALPSYQHAITLLLYIGIMALVSRTYYVQRRMIDELADSNIKLRSKLLSVGQTDALV
jgi:K+-sensing histidine kinase KdpD